MKQRRAMRKVMRIAKGDEEEEDDVKNIGRDTKGRYGGGAGAGKHKGEGRDKRTHDTSKARVFRAQNVIGKDVYFARKAKELGAKTLRDGMDVTVVPPIAAGDEWWKPVETYSKYYHCDEVKNAQKELEEDKASKDVSEVKQGFDVEEGMHG